MDGCLPSKLFWSSIVSPLAHAIDLQGYVGAIHDLNFKCFEDGLILPRTANEMQINSIIELVLFLKQDGRLKGLVPTKH